VYVCRGIRGATVAKENTAAAIHAATRELLSELIDANDVEERDVAAVYFTMTPDLNASFPAAAAFRPGVAAVVRPGAPANDAPEPYKVISTARMSSLVGLTR